MWQFKSSISLIPQSLLPPNLKERCLIMSGNRPWCHMTLWPRNHVRSHDKLKTSYLLLQKVYHHKTLQGSHLWWGTIIWPLSRVRSRDKKNEIFFLKNACGHQLGMMATYDEENSPVMSHNSLNKLPYEATWQNKNEISPLLQNPWPPNLAGWWLIIRETHP